MQNTSLTTKIDHLLEEARIVLPGSQTILGFQLVAVFTDGFTQLTYGLQLVHLLSLCFILLSVILLMSTTAYHRIVERGEVTNRFHQFSSRIVLLAMLTMAIGLSTDLYVVGMKITRSYNIALALSMGCFLATMLLWFGYTGYKRKNQKKTA